MSVVDLWSSRKTRNRGSTSTRQSGEACLHELDSRWEAILKASYY
jgi:hypothetical protein